MLTADGRVVCRAVGTTAWAVLADIVLDAKADTHGNLVAATNVRRIAGDLGIGKDTAARALARLVDAGLVVRHCRRGTGGQYDRSLYELRLDSADGITVVVPAPVPPSPCPVSTETDTETRRGPAPGAAVKEIGRPEPSDRGARRGQRRSRPGQEALFELGTDATEPR